MKKTALAVAIAAAMSATPSLAQQWYAGLGFSSTRGDVDTARINSDLTNNLGFFTAETSSDTKDSAARGFVGYSVLPWLDVEGYYAQLGDTQFDSTVTPSGTLSVTIASKAYGLVALPGFSPAKGLKVFGKIGVARVESRANPVGTGFVQVTGGAKESNTGATYGLGMTYALNGNAAVRVEYDVHKDLGGDSMGGKFDVKAATIAMQFRF